MLRIRNAICLLSLLSFVAATRTTAQTNSFQQTNLTSDTQGLAANTDPKLLNPWGIAFFPGEPFWVSDNNSGFTTLYDQHGANVGQFAVPSAAGAGTMATPTGIVANLGGTGFKVNGTPAVFIFAAEDGTISAWNGVDAVTKMVDNSLAGAVYKGAALVNLGQSGTFLLVTNFNSGLVEVYDSNFHASHLIGDLTDPQLPAGYAPFGVHVLNQEIFVTYALQDQAEHDPVHQAGAGLVDLFDLNGGFGRQVALHGNLNAPWGMVIPPAGFGPFGGKVLVGEFGDGTIDVYDLNTGAFIDKVKDSNGAAITNASLWDMVFGGGGASGDPNTLYLTAGLENEQHGLFATLTPTAAGNGAADFTIGANPTQATITAGQSAAFQVTIGGLNGFNSAVTFSCSGEPANSTCSFAPTTVTPTSGGTVTTTFTLSTKAPSPGYHPMAMPFSASWLNLTGSLVMIVLLLVSRRLAYASDGRRRAFRLIGAASILLTGVSILAGCGGYGSNGAGTPTGASNLMVIAKSGNTSHAVNINLTVH